MTSSPEDDLKEIEKNLLRVIAAAERDMSDAAARRDRAQAALKALRPSGGAGGGVRQMRQPDQLLVALLVLGRGDSHDLNNSVERLFGQKLVKGSISSQISNLIRDQFIDRSGPNQDGPILSLTETGRSRATAIANENGVDVSSTDAVSDLNPARPGK